MDLETFLISVFVLVDDWCQTERPAKACKPGRPPLLSGGEVLTLAILAHWPRWRSERDFWRLARAYLRSYFPDLLSQSQLNRRIRAQEPEMRRLQRHMAETLSESFDVYHILDTTLIPTVVCVRACRKGLFAGQAVFGRCVSKTEWIYGFKVALSVSPVGVVIASNDHDSFLADKGFSSVEWERYWLEEYGALVAATSQENSRRAWPEKARWWAAGKRQLIEGVIDQLKTSSPWSATGRRRSEVCSLVWLRRWLPIHGQVLNSL